MAETKKNQKETPKKKFDRITIESNAKLLRFKRDERPEMINKLIAEADVNILFIDARHEGLKIETGTVVLESVERSGKEAYIGNISCQPNGKFSYPIFENSLKVIHKSLKENGIKDSEIAVCVLDNDSADAISKAIIASEIFTGAKGVFAEELVGADIAFDLELDVPDKKKDKKKKKNKKKKGKKKND